MKRSKYSKRAVYRPKIKQLHDGAAFGGEYTGEDYTADEIAFMMACDDAKRTKQKTALSAADILAVARSLGYEKTVEADLSNLCR